MVLSRVGSWCLRETRHRPLNTVVDVELITADYTTWYNQQRLMHRLGRVPPADAEARYYAQAVTDQPAGSQKTRRYMKPGTLHTATAIDSSLDCT